GRGTDTVDRLTVAGPLPGGPAPEFVETTDPDHPRVRRALRRRADVRVRSATGGVLVPDGQPVWSQQATGNARSIRAFQATGHRPAGAEALMLLPHR
ncbi:GNAT family N-acetyltransferase, partial [Streptomyces sp. NPDC054840]